MQKFRVAFAPKRQNAKHDPSFSLEGPNNLQECFESRHLEKWLRKDHFASFLYLLFEAGSFTIHIIGDRIAATRNKKMCAIYFSAGNGIAHQIAAIVHGFHCANKSDGINVIYTCRIRVIHERWLR